MIKFFSKQLKNKKGFTLVELIVAVAILGILSAIAVPQIGKFRVNAAIASHNANVRTLESVANMYITEGGNPNKTKLDKEDLKDYVGEWPEIPSILSGKTFGGKDEEKVNFEMEDYKVEIENGKVTVLPGRIVGGNYQ